MAYRIQITEEARDQLRALPKELRSNIGYRLELLTDNLTGDVKKLHGVKNVYRLRVGEYRVLFSVNGDIIEVSSVKIRQGAYE